MRVFMAIGIIMAVLVWLPAESSGITITVEDEDGTQGGLTIQEGLDAASDGDTVLVESGTYIGEDNRNLDFNGKRVLLVSESGLGSCTIDPEGNGRGFAFTSGEDRDSVVQGFRIFRGLDPFRGGGVYCDGASPTFKNCLFDTCQGDTVGGGGLYAANGSAPLLVNCTFQDCTTWVNGGAMHCTTNSPPEIRFCTFVSCSGTYPACNGGGLYCEIYSPPTVYNSVFMGNSVGNEGGGAYLFSNCPGTFRNCAFVGNTATASHGGGIRADSYCSLDIINCTFADNVCGANGGSIALNANATLSILNSILWNDTSPVMAAWAHGGVSVNYTDIQGGWVGSWNLDVDPAFAPGPNGSHYLSTSSPCVGTGESLAVDTCFDVYCLDEFTTRADETTDWGRVDMGYHYVPSSYTTPTPTPWQPPVPATGGVGCWILLAAMGLLLGAGRLART